MTFVHAINFLMTVACTYIAHCFFAFNTSYISEVYSKSSETSKMDLLAKIVNDFQSLTIYLKISILDIYWTGF